MNTDNFRINLNQNLWVLVVALVTLGTAEYFRLCSLYWFGLILSIVSSVSLFFTLSAYTYSYCKSKFTNKKSNSSGL
jgi:hypothetical protein